MYKYIHFFQYFTTIYVAHLLQFKKLYIFSQSSYAFGFILRINNNYFPIQG